MSYTLIRSIIENPSDVLGEGHTQESYKNIIHLKVLYKDISTFYNISNFMNELTSTTFKHYGILNEFYILFWKVVRATTRIEHVRANLDISFLGVIMKYDYYFEGIIDRELENEDYGYDMAVINNTIVIKSNYSIKVYDLSFSLLHQFKNETSGTIVPFYDNFIIIKQMWKMDIWDLHTGTKYPVPDMSMVDSSDVVVLPNKRLVYSIDNYKFIIWNFESQDIEIKIPKDPHTYIQNIILLKNGNIGISYDTIFEIWNKQDKVFTFDNNEDINKIIELSDGRFVIHSESQVHILGKSPFHVQEYINKIMELPGNKLLISSKNKLTIWNINTKRLIYTYNERVLHINILPSGDIIMGLSDNNIGILNLSTYTLRIIPIKDDVFKIIILKDNRILIGSEDFVRIYI